MDVINDLAVPLSLSFLAELLGIPADQHPDLGAWSAAFVATPGETQESQAARDLSAFLLTLLAQRRRHPQQDLLSRLQDVEIAGTRPDDAEIVSCCYTLLLSALSTIPHLIGNAVLCLIEHPEVIERLRNAPAPIYSTLDEVLRYLPPIWIVQRITRSEIGLGEQLLPAQAQISAWIVSANRDARHFTQPELFDIDRIPNRHLSFGDDGAHSCLGAGLTRLITRIPLLLLAQQCTDITFLPGYTGTFIDAPTLFGAKQLPITFRPLHRTRESL